MSIFISAHDWKRAVLGQTGLSVGRLGLASSYGADSRCVAMAFERGVNYFYWGTFRRRSFAAGLRDLAGVRDRFVLVLQSYSRVPALLPWSIERALRRLRMDRCDVLLLGLWNKPISPGVLDRAMRLRDRGLVGHLAVSTHQREMVRAFAAEFGVIHFRYNAIHTGAEPDIFPHFPAAGARPGMVSYTATSWGQLLNCTKLPPGERAPTAGDCYRFVLSNPMVDVCLSGPSNAAQCLAALEGWEQGPMTEDELQWMRRVGEAKYAR